MITVKHEPSEFVSLGVEYSCRVLRFKQFLPAGPTSDGGQRDRSLVQLWTDPGGMRTVAITSITLGRKNKTVYPKQMAHGAMAQDDQDQGQDD